MKSVVPLILALGVPICEASPTETPVPWVEKKAYTAKEGQLFSTRCLTPESSSYIGYSVYPRDDSGGESNKKEFAQGFYAYRPDNNPARPFTREKVASPVRMVKEMKTFPNHDRTPYAKTGRYVVMDSDSPCYHIAMNMAMANRFGHPYFFLDRKKDRKTVKWKSPKGVRFHLVTATENPEGWIVAIGGIPLADASGSAEAGAWWICPATGECKQIHSLDWSVSSDDLSSAEWLDCDRIVNIGWSRWSGRLSVLNARTGKTEYETGLGLDGTRGDKLIVGHEIWMTEGEHVSARVYPAPLEDPESPLKVSLESYESEDPFSFSFGLRLTLTNRSGKEISLPGEWGKNALFRFVWKEEDGAEKTEQLMELDRHIHGTDAARVLNPGESITTSSMYEINDVRTFPNHENIELSVTVSPVMEKGKPGNGRWTSALVNIGNPVGKTRGHYHQAMEEGKKLVKLLKAPENGIGSRTVHAEGGTPVTASWTGKPEKGILSMVFSDQARGTMWTFSSPGGSDWVDMGKGYFLCMDRHSGGKSAVMLVALPGKRGETGSLWNTLLEKIIDFSKAPSPAAVAVCDLSRTFWKVRQAMEKHIRTNGPDSAFLTVNEEDGKLFLTAWENGSGKKVESEEILPYFQHYIYRESPVWISPGTTVDMEKILKNFQS